MSEGSEILNTYKREYDTLYESLRNKADAIAATDNQDQKKLLIGRADRELEEADEIISQMEVELASLAASLRMRLAPIVRSSKDELKAMRATISKSKSQSERDQLLASRNGHIVDFEVAGMDQRQRLLQGTDRLQDGSRRLEDTRRLALETEQIGIQTLEDLNRQREQIQRTQNRLASADQWISKSQGVLRGMHRRMMTNKMLTFGIIGLLILLIIVIIWIKWF